MIAQAQEQERQSPLCRQAVSFGRPLRACSHALVVDAGVTLSACTAGSAAMCGRGGEVAAVARKAIELTMVG